MVCACGRVSRAYRHGQIESRKTLESEMPVRHAMLVGLSMLFPCPGVAQDSTSAPTHERTATLLAGFGNDMGWFGLQGEYYVAGDRVSIFAGLGYTPEQEARNAAGVTPAVGVRGFTAGLRHRGFLELSVSQIAIQTDPVGVSTRHFGPGIQAGYQFSAVAGFTLMISGGLGYAIGVDESLENVTGLVGIGLGYTWR